MGTQTTVMAVISVQQLFEMEYFLESTAYTAYIKCYVLCKQDNTGPWAVECIPIRIYSDHGIKDSETRSIHLHGIFCTFYQKVVLSYFSKKVITIQALRRSNQYLAGRHYIALA